MTTARTLLLVEDEGPLRANLQRFLTAEGYAVITAVDGAEGIRVARESRPDLIICDVLMPQVDGYQLLAALRADPETARLPLIFISASADRDDRLRGLKHGAHDYITKPFKLEQLLNAVRKCLPA